MIVIRQKPSHSIQISSRRGLAPLELVLALPILVMMMALMVNAGVVGAWKVRTQVNARYAGWRTLTVRSGEFNATPPYWPTNAPLTAVGGTDLVNVGQLWEADRDLTCPCARGDRLTAPSSPTPVNVPGRLELDGSVVRGNAQLDRPLPVFPGAIPGSGRFRFDHNEDLFDNHWQFHTLGIPHNDFPRARVWWDIEHADLAALDPQITRYKDLLDRNHQLLINNPRKDDLYPLDNDDEHIRYYGWPPPDFIPRIRSACTGDVGEVNTRIVGPTVIRIQRLPVDMARRFLSMYSRWACELEMCGNTGFGYNGIRQREDDTNWFLTGMPRTRGPCMCPRPPCPCPPSPDGVGK